MRISKYKVYDADTETHTAGESFVTSKLMYEDEMLGMFEAMYNIAKAAERGEELLLPGRTFFGPGW